MMNRRKNTETCLSFSGIFHDLIREVMSCVEICAQAALSKLPGQGKQAGNPVAILKVLGWKVN